MKLDTLLPFFALVPFTAVPALVQEDADGERLAPVQEAPLSPERAAPPSRGLTPRRGGPEVAPDAAVASRGFLGIRLGDRGAETTIVEVLPDTPAAAAGLQPGDRLVTLGGRPAISADAVVADLGRRPAGERVTIEVLREGRLLEVEAVLDARPEDGVSGAPRLDPRAPRAPAPRGFGFPPQGGFSWPDTSPLRLDDLDVQRWMVEQERRSARLFEQLERQFSDLRREFGSDLDGLKRDVERGLGRGGGWFGSRFGDEGPAPLDIPAEAWADLEERLAPLEEERRRIAREWAESHGRPEWAEAVPPFGVRVRIERREERRER